MPIVLRFDVVILLVCVTDLFSIRLKLQLLILSTFSVTGLVSSFMGSFWSIVMAYWWGVVFGHVTTVYFMGELSDLFRRVFTTAGLDLFFVGSMMVLIFATAMSCFLLFFLRFTIDIFAVFFSLLWRGVIKGWLWLFICLVSSINLYFWSWYSMSSLYLLLANGVYVLHVLWRT